MSDAFLRLRSQWSQHHFPAVADNRGAQLLAWQWQFERSERLAPQVRADAQYVQLGRVIAHHREHSTFFSARLARAGLSDVRDWDAALLALLPLLTRDDIQRADSNFWSEVPSPHGAVAENSTTGSTGQALRIRRSAANQMLWHALTLREHLWWGWDERHRLAVIRYFQAGDPVAGDGRLASWGGALGWLYDTGPAFVRSGQSGVTELLDWLQRVDPHYLLLYPSMLAAMLDAHEAAGLPRPKSLNVVRTLAETVSPALRQRCLALWGCQIVDAYSSQECGVIALQCPDSGQMHVMAESVLTEVLNEQGQACAPGEVGQLVVSDLHNFATPLLRYALGDHVELAATACPCGRSLPSFTRILGRRRNMITLPDGRKIWPVVGQKDWMDILTVRQIQFVQKTLVHMVVRLWLDQPMTVQQSKSFTAVLKNNFHPDMVFEFVVSSSELPKGPGGKFEEVVSELL